MFHSDIALYLHIHRVEIGDHNDLPHSSGIYRHSSRSLASLPAGRITGLPFSTLMVLQALHAHRSLPPPQEY